MRTFIWSADWSAPQKYPVQLLNGLLTMPRIEDYELYKGPNMTGRRKRSEFFKENKPIPRHLYVKWYSITENTFWQGCFNLPYNLMLELFKHGFTRYKKKTPLSYNEIRIGLMPRGVVVIWLYGNGRLTEIGRYQAMEG